MKKGTMIFLSLMMVCCLSACADKSETGVATDWNVEQTLDNDVKTEFVPEKEEKQPNVIYCLSQMTQYNKDGQSTGSIAYEYDEYGREINWIQKGTRIESVYDEDGNKSESYVYANNELVQRQEHQYDTEGRLIKTNIYNNSTKSSSPLIIEYT